MVVFGEEEEIGDETGCEQNEANEQKSFWKAGHGKEDDGAGRDCSQGLLGEGVGGGHSSTKECGEKCGGDFGWGG